MAEPRLPAGFQLEAGESVIRTGKDWGISLNPLILTSQRLICPVDPSTRAYVSIRLSDIRDVRLRKPMFGFNTVIVDYGEEQQASFPAHINAARIRQEIREAVKAQHPRISREP